MWLLGLGGLFTILSIAIVLVNRNPGLLPEQSRYWDMNSQATSYAGMMAPLASFSVTTAVFVANVSRQEHADQLENVMALFIIGFMAFVGSGVGFATTRSAVIPAQASPAFVRVTRLQFVWAYALFFIGISLTWLGLKPLVEVIGLHDLGELLQWALLLAVFGAAANQGFWQHYVAGTSVICSLATPGFALVGAGVYHLIILALFPELKPPRGVIDLVRVAFAFGMMAFVSDLTVLRLHGLPRADALLVWLIPKVAPPTFTCAAATVFLIWFGLAW